MAFSFIFLQCIYIQKMISGQWRKFAILTFMNNYIFSDVDEESTR